jgi:peroxiredoxin
MRKNWHLAAAVVFFSPLFLLLRGGEQGANAPRSPVNFTLKDTQDRPVSLASFKDKKAVMVVFIGTRCPINNLYLPRLGELFKEFAPQGVGFLAINSNWQDSPKDIADHAKKYQVPFPVLRDENNRVADLFHAGRTPEAFVLDAQRVIRYQGRIDDRYGIDYQKPQAQRHDLAEALKEVLAGKTVSISKTPVAGCIIAHKTTAKNEGTVTFARDVSRILQKNCQDCHRPGQIGPFSLLTYRDARAWAETIREVVSDRRMPPWYADLRYGHFSNDRSLPAKEREALLAWIDQGMPKGDDKDLPPPRVFPEVWKIGKPDLIVQMPVDFEVPAKMPKYGVPYKHFVVQTNFAEDRWVQRAEARAGAAEVVHHIIVFIVPPGEKFIPGNPRTPTLCGTAPGEMPFMLPVGFAKKIPKGSKLVFQMHYTPNGKAQKDRSEIGLIFAKKPPEKEVVTVPVYNFLFRIPPGEPNYKLESSFTFKKDGVIVGFMPHMHLRGKDFLYRARYPDKKTEILLSVPRFNFNWQSVYRPAKAIPMPKGTVLECVAHFDNSAKNPNNPDPTAAVRWGDQTWEEMMVGWVDIAYDRTPDVTR